MMAHENYDQAFKILFRYSDRASSKYFRALEQLEKMQRARRRDEQRAGTAPPRPGNPFIAPLPVPEHEPELASFGATATGAAPGAVCGAEPGPPSDAAGNDAQYPENELYVPLDC